MHSQMVGLKFIAGRWQLCGEPLSAVRLLEYVWVQQ